MSDSIPLKICTRCKIAKPAISEYFSPQAKCESGFYSQCKTCKNELAKERRKANPEHTKEINKRSREKHRDKRNQQTRVWFAKHPGYKRDWEKNHPEQVKQYKNTTRLRHSAEISIYNRNYHKTHIDGIHARHKKYREENRLLLRVKDHNRRAKEYGLPNSLTLEQWNECLKYWDNKCCICGRATDFWHIIAKEHWIPIADERDDNPGTVATNILPMCHSISGASPDDIGCNNNKWRHDPLKWLVGKYGKRKANKILKQIDKYFEWVANRDK